MWKYPRTLFFPFSGRLDSWRFMGTPSAMLDAYAEIVTRPAIVAVEVVGLALLGWVIRKAKLHRKSPLGRLLSTGRMDMPGTPLHAETANEGQKGKVHECE
jgi:hypothetical protein